MGGRENSRLSLCPVGLYNVGVISVFANGTEMGLDWIVQGVVCLSASHSRTPKVWDYVLFAATSVLVAGGAMRALRGLKRQAKLGLFDDLSLGWLVYQEGWFCSNWLWDNIMLVCWCHRPLCPICFLIFNPLIRCYSSRWSWQAGPCWPSFLHSFHDALVSISCCAAVACLKGTKSTWPISSCLNLISFHGQFPTLITYFRCAG